MPNPSVTLPQGVRVEETAHGVKTVAFLPPPGWVVVSDYTPHSCPWDCYGNDHNRVMAAVLLKAGIQSLQLRTIQTRTSPQGTGPGGMVRFGDDMLPGRYTVAVAEENKTAALQAIADHEAAIRKWLDNEGPMPAVLRN